MPSQVVDNLNFMIVRFEQGWDKWEYRFILTRGGFDMCENILAKKLGMNNLIHLTDNVISSLSA